MYKCSACTIRTSSVLETLLIPTFSSFIQCLDAGSEQELPTHVAPSTPEPGVPPTACAPAPDTRPACNHHLPTHYHDGGIGHDSDVQESLDIYCDSDGVSSDASQSQVASAQGTTNATTTAVNTATTDPLATGQSSRGHSTRRGKNISYDINHFFNRGKEHTICLPSK